MYETVLFNISLLISAVPITSGYTESDAFYNPMLWYDRPQPGMKRSAHQAALDAYSMIDTCGYYNHLQTPSLKYMKPEPVTYYHYTNETERYHNSIAVSVQNQVHSTFGSGTLANYTPSQYASYSTATAAAAAAAAAAAYGSLSADSCNVYNLSHHVVTPSQVTNASDPQGLSPARPSRFEDGNITAPLTPPLSVSPVGGDSPAAPSHSMTSNPGLPHTSESAVSYHRSGSASPCEQADCDSTTHTDHLLAEEEIIPKLPLHVLSDLSEGLPLPGPG